VNEIAAVRVLFPGCHEDSGAVSDHSTCDFKK